MLKKGWKAVLKSLHKGTFKFSTRNLSVQESKKLEKINNEQQRLLERFEAIFKKYENRLEKISHVMEQGRSGNLSNLESYVREMQKELHRSLSRAEIALIDTKDLEKELADWNSLKEQGKNCERSKAVSSELELRGITTSTKDSSPKQEAPVPNEERVERVEVEPLVVHCHIRRISNKKHLEHKPEQLIGHIKVLTKELNAYQMHPEANPRETLRMAKELKDYHGRLRMLDRVQRGKRDRISLSNGLATV